MRREEGSFGRPPLRMWHIGRGVIRERAIDAVPDRCPICATPKDRFFEVQ